MGTITVTNLGKAYKQYSSRWARLAEWIFLGHKPRHTHIWVMQGVSFIVNPGEAVGIIGINGAGKSTLLKMITGTTKPTTGSVITTGKIAALLELGMGFHPDFTGRQNAYMAGQLLGHSVEEIDQLMSEIIAFAEIGDYLDQPVRVYSSGMQVRLAFSVATAIRPDVLIVDEALSVGDIFFQQKCMERISEFRKQGTTLLLVTHDFASLASVCSRAILLQNGRLEKDGPCPAVIEKYFEAISKKKGKAERIELQPEKYIQNTTSEFEHYSNFISNVKIVGSENIDGLIVTEDSAQIQLRLKNLSDFNDPHVGFRIQDTRGNIVYETNSFCQYVNISESISEGREFYLTIEFTVNFCPGEYTLAIGAENEGYSDGFFKNVIFPTKIILNFVVVANPTKPKWGGQANIYPFFSVRV